jgi:hypothetical protein
VYRPNDVVVGLQMTVGGIDPDDNVAGASYEGTRTWFLEVLCVGCLDPQSTDGEVSRVQSAATYAENPEPFKLPLFEYYIIFLSPGYGYLHPPRGIATA